MSDGGVDQPPAISVVIAVQESVENLVDIIHRLEPEVSDTTEILICGERSELTNAPPERQGLRHVEGRDDAAIPELWRDGILAATGEGVALLTAHCVPSTGWLSRLRELDLSRTAGYGGRIEEPAGSSCSSRAIHRLRYASAASAETGEVADIAADNAYYCRADILRCDDLLAEGFWEPAYHARFRERGKRLVHLGDLVVFHVNQYSPGAFMRQRFRHGFNFGHHRAEAVPPPMRWIMVAASPLAFVIHGAKNLRKVAKSPALRRGFFPALPWYLLYLASWSTGEAAGYLSAATSTLQSRRPDA